ncbi:MULTISPECIES: WG repeat-containing protein [Maribacter]|uniref:WG repeat-containing protein n=1 Tax=Maribacter flavus TaxID=1658664 RepID=A0ABU7IG31_9FLAO|nr:MULTISPECIES: WG repeat-containing protein [Maribacter]MDC6405292.1 WG repeat-containing protein [Maribacter sp. PR66]MEE1971899.1 WG repeat-containing protein [Maribacter flavus]
MRTKLLLLTFLLMLPLALPSQELKGIDEIAPFSEGLAAVRQGEKWGFIDENGTLVIDFRNDVYWNNDADTSKSDISGVRYPMFQEGRCLITKNVEDGIAVYGFMDTKGKTIIEPQFLNVFPFKNGYTTGVLFDKALKGKNEFKLDIYEFKFFDVLLDASGEIDEYFERRHNILMTKKRYQVPTIGAKYLAENLVAIYGKDQGWEIRKLAIKN